jgi:hypothetical protein
MTNRTPTERETDESDNRNCFYGVRRGPGTVTRSDLQPIEPAALYPRTVFQRISGFGDGALAEARRAGLKVRYAHGRAFIFGGDAIAYIMENGKAEKDAPQ